MSVKNRHADYQKFIGKWMRCRDVMCGQDAVHARGEAYLPKLKDQSQEEYSTYVKRTPFYNATWRTIEGMRGMIFRKPPKVEVPAKAKDMLDDVTMDGKPLQVFLMPLIADALGLGRCGILVDYPTVGLDVNYTQADAERENLRPLMAYFQAEQIINWAHRRVNNRTVLSQVVLEECRYIIKDEFTREDKMVYRVLDLDEENGNYYRVRVFEVTSDGKDVLIEGPYWPLMNGRPLDFIPFYFIGADNNDWTPDDPPMIDLVDLNLSHYRTRADYEHGCHFTGLPTPWIAGFTPETDENGAVKQKMYIGSLHAWTFPDPNAKAGYLEFTGTGLGALEKNLDKKEAQMAVLGARMLEEQKRAAEAAETAALHRTGENSILSAITQSCSLGVKGALKTFCEWGGTDGEIEFELNRDFFPIPMDANLLNALVNAWQKGAFSHETLFFNLQQREVIERDTTFEQEKTKIDNEGPTLSSASPMGNASLVPPAPVKKTVTKTGDGKYEIEEQQR